MDLFVNCHLKLHIDITLLLPPFFNRTTCIRWHPQLRTRGFCWSRFYCTHVVADNNQHIGIREKMLEFSSTVLPNLPLYSS